MKGGYKDPSNCENYAEIIRDDIQKKYAITVKAHDTKSRADREWNLPHHPALNLNKPAEVRRVFKVSASSKMSFFKIDEARLSALEGASTFLKASYDSNSYQVSIMSARDVSN